MMTQLRMTWAQVINSAAAAEIRDTVSNGVNITG
jgi:hypothetical protein